MAITLDTFAAIGSTPIANNTTAEKTFLNDYFKVVAPSLSPRERKSLWALGLIYKLAATGVNYKTNHKGLIQDAQVFVGCPDTLDLAGALAIAAWNSGKTADGTLSADVPTLMGEARDLVNLSEPDLDQIIIYLRAQLV